MNRRAKHRSRLSLPVLLTGILGSLALAASMNGTLAAMSLSIDNTANTAGIQSMVFNEKSTSDATVCSNSGSNGSNTSCSIDKYGGAVNLTAASSGTPVEVHLWRTGKAPITGFSVVFGACTGSTAALLCSTTYGTGMGIRVEHSVDGGSTWLDLITNSSTVTTRTAAGWAANSTIPSPQLGNIVNRLNLSTSEATGAWFRFTPTAPTTGSGEYITQSIKWSITN